MTSNSAAFDDVDDASCVRSSGYCAVVVAAYAGTACFFDNGKKYCLLIRCVGCTASASFQP